MSDAVVNGVRQRRKTPSSLLGAREARPVVERGRSCRERRGLDFILPFFVMFLFFLVIPIVYALYDSLFTSRLVGGTVFSGLANYKSVLTTSAFWTPAPDTDLRRHPGAGNDHHRRLLRHHV